MSENNKAEAGAVKKTSNTKASSKKGGKSGKKKSPVVKFLKELKSELKKVVWPSKEKVVNNTTVVLSGMVLAGLIIYAFDLGLSELMKLIINLGG